MTLFIEVSTQDFDMASEYQALIQDNPSDGAVVTFTGLVRDFNQGQSVTGLTLEHYPAMTTKALEAIAEQAFCRWPLGRIRLIHRVGELALNEQIVFVGVSSRHREAAFAAAQFIMDYLKNQAPFWKKEQTESGQRWVEFNQKDKQAIQQWQHTKETQND